MNVVLFFVGFILVVMLLAICGGAEFPIEEEEKKEEK